MRWLPARTDEPTPEPRRRGGNIMSPIELWMTFTKLTPDEKSVFCALFFRWMVDQFDTEDRREQ
jgi:hypothetical protein